MTKVPRNKGSYSVSRYGTYQVKFPLGWSDGTKRYEEYRESVSSEAEAIALIKSINDFVYHGGAVTDVPSWRRSALGKDESGQMTVSEFGWEYIGLRERLREVEPRTIQSDRDCFKRIEPRLGAMRLGEVSPQAIDEAYAEMRSGERPYSGTTLQKTHAFLSMMFAKAVDYGYIAKNPCEKVRKPKRDTEEKRSLTVEQAKALFSAIESEDLCSKSVGILIALFCGLRESELLALKWSDYRGGCLHVTKSLVREKQEFKKTKNGESRVVPCPPPLVAVLDRWRSEQREWYAEVGLEWGCSSPIVQSKVGNHVLQRSFIRWFEQKRTEWPIPDDFTVHGLRHTYTTLMTGALKVDPKTAMSMTGHKSDQAFQTYTHTTDDWQNRAATEYGALIAPAAGEGTCARCRYWARSPVDPSMGTCWANRDGRASVTEGSSPCLAGLYAAAG